jgi:hypothetical protein
MATHAATRPGLEPGQHVRIAIPGRERATACVMSVNDGWLALRIVGVVAPRPRDLDGEHGAVEYIDDDGIHRLRGEIEAAADLAVSAIRFVLRAGAGAQFLGRRQHMRAALKAPVVLTDERTCQKFHGRSLNVSEGGMLVGDLGSGLPGPGSLLRFALAPRASRDPIFGVAKVMRADESRGTLALDFEEFSKAASDELARIIYEHEQNSRGARRR